MKRSLFALSVGLPVLLSAQVLNKPKVALRNWATGFTQPVAITNCGDSRLFVVEKAGRVRIVSDSMQVVAQPFLDISDHVNSVGNEQGLLGLAFPQNYADSGYFFVYYIFGPGNGTSRVSRFRVTADPDSADAASEQVIYSWPQPYTNHNGGDIHFGPDGYLYVGFGDGGSGYDPEQNGQDYTEPLAGMIRIDVSDPDTTYTIPPSNPFATSTSDTLPEVWATGLRNPWRWGFDRLTGDLWIGDVGQDTWEEVDFWPAGDNSCPNFGWRCREGFIATPTINQANCLAASAYVEPQAAFAHAGQGWCSVIGGRVYRGEWYPHHAGHYIFTDYCAGDLLTFAAGSMTDVDTMLLTSTAGFAVIAEDSAGQLYVGNQLNGQVKKIYDPCPMGDPTITSQGDTALAATEANSYQWYMDGAPIQGATAQIYVPEATGNYQVVCNFGSPCSLISDTLLFIFDGMNDPAMGHLRLYPQPARDEVVLERQSTEASTVELADGIGRVVVVARWAEGQTRMHIAVGQLPNGLYSVRSLAGNDAGTLSGRMLVAH